MRISLVERDREPRKKKSRKRNKRRRYRTYESAIAQPLNRPKRRTSRRRASSRVYRSNNLADSAQTAPQAGPSIWARIRWRSLFLRLPALVVIVALAGVMFYTSTEAQFFVYGAEIQGNYYVATEQIYQHSKVHEQNIFWIRPQEVASKIEAIPGIKSARVRCGLPARVTITVEEREPVVMWRTMTSGGDWWIDQEGVVLPYHGDAQSPETIFVVDWSERQLLEGQTIQPLDIVTWVQRLDSELPGAQVFYYQAERGLNFTQEKEGHTWPVFVGDGTDLTRKILALRALTNHLSTNNIYPSFVDVRWPDLPVYGQPEASQAQGSN